MNQPNAVRKSPGIYPWVMAVTGMFALFLSNGFTATGITIFDPSLLDEYGWSRGDFKFRDALNFWTTAAIAPFIGILIDKLNPKHLLMIGFSLLTLGYFGYSMLSNSGPVLIIELIAVLTIVALAGVVVLAMRTLTPKVTLPIAIGLATIGAAIMFWFYTQYWMGTALKQVYIIHLMFSLALSTAGTMVVIFLVSSWFVKYRGLAIGIALVGTSMGSAILPLLNPILIERFGWRQAYFYNAFLPIVMLLFVWVFVKGTPRHAGTVAVGQSDQVADLKQHGLTYGEAIRTRTFWAIGISGFLTYYAIFGFVQHLVLHLTKSFDFSIRQAGQILFAFSIIAMLAKLFNGALADRIDRHKVFMGCLVIMLVGVIGLATLKREWVIGSALIIGLGWGGLFTLYNMLAVNNFGLKEIGRINGSISLMESIGVGFGSWITGKLFDAYGDYQIAFEVIAGCVFVALIIGTQIRSEVDERAVMQSPR